MILFIRSDGTFDDEVFATTSFDLINWTGAQDLGFEALDAPDASCVPFGYCTMAWVPAYQLDPKAATKSFTINPSTGAVQWGSSRSSSFSDVPRGVGITASRVAGNPTTQNWLAAIVLPGTHTGDLSVPSYEVFWSFDPGDPPVLAPESAASSYGRIVSRQHSSGEHRVRSVDCRLDLHHHNPLNRRRHEDNNHRICDTVLVRDPRAGLQRGTPGCPAASRLRRHPEGGPAAHNVAQPTLLIRPEATQSRIRRSEGAVSTRGRWDSVIS